MKELTHEDASRFWDYLDKEHLHIYIQLPNKSFQGGEIISHKPARMSEKDYIEYERILKSWLGANGFT